MEDMAGRMARKHMGGGLERLLIKNNNGYDEEEAKLLGINSNNHEASYYSTEQREQEEETRRGRREANSCCWSSQVPIEAEENFLRQLERRKRVNQKKKRQQGGNEHHGTSLSPFERLNQNAELVLGLLEWLPLDLSTLAAVSVTCSRWHFYVQFLPHWERWANDSFGRAEASRTFALMQFIKEKNAKQLLRSDYRQKVGGRSRHTMIAATSGGSITQKQARCLHDFAFSFKADIRIRYQLDHGGLFGCCALPGDACEVCMCSCCYTYNDADDCAGFTMAGFMCFTLFFVSAGVWHCVVSVMQTMEMMDILPSQFKDTDACGVCNQALTFLGIFTCPTCHTCRRRRLLGAYSPVMKMQRQRPLGEMMVSAKMI